MRAAWVAAALLLAARDGPHGLEFKTFLGKAADPCNGALDYRVPALRDCNQVALQAVNGAVVLLPSNTSVVVAGDPAQYTGAPGVAASSDAVPLVLTAVGLPWAVSSTFVALSTAAGRCAAVDNTTVVAAATDPLRGTVTFLHPAEWVTADLEAEDGPRLLCWSLDGSGWQYTGFQVRVVWNCNDQYNDTRCTSEARQAAVDGLPGLAGAAAEAWLQRTACCRGPLGLGIGQCVNSNEEGCCGGTAYPLPTARCCDPAAGSVAAASGTCRCPNATACPAEEACCPSADAAVAAGSCYRLDTQRCCATGDVFDPGKDQCCRITGVQSLDVPCPCGSDSDCVSPSGGTDSHLCCIQTAPPFAFLALCSSAAAPDASRRSCPGVCFDPRSGVCCNGRPCRKHFESCCNATCCNTQTSTCLHGYRHMGTAIELVDVCSAVEHPDDRRGVWTFVLPALLLAAAVGSVFAVAVATRWLTTRVWTPLEWTMVALATVVMALGLPLSFAPTYKYSIWAFWSQIVVIITAAMLLGWLNIVCVGVSALTLLYFLDPFQGNALLTLSSDRLPSLPSPQGIVDSGGALAFASHLPPSRNSRGRCVEFYDWFLLDPLLSDPQLSNPATRSWGYCSGDWSVVLLFLSAGLILLSILQLLLALFGLLSRFRRQRVELAITPVAPD